LITYINLAKLDDGLDESPTVMVEDKKTKTKNKLAQAMLGSALARFELH
jgi:hypothetical protein